MNTTTPVAQAIALLGGPSAVARVRGLTPWAISKWKDRIPAEHVLWLAEATGWKHTPHALAPELYPHPADGLPATLRRVAKRRADAAAAGDPSPKAA